MDYPDLIEAMEARSAVYNLLERVFRIEVDEAFLNELMQSKFPQNTGNDHIDDAYLRIYRYLRNANDETLDELACDYARTFLGFGSPDGKAAHPYESVYTSDKGLLMQDSRDEVLAIYRSEGLDKALTWRDPEDHLAMQLQFIRFLCDKTIDALSRGDETHARSLLETQRNFIDDHILVWNDAFTMRVHRYARTIFYSAYADLLHAFLIEDTELLYELLDEKGDELDD